MPERDPADYRPRSGSSTSWAMVAVLVAVAAVGAAWWLWGRLAQESQPPAAAVTTPAAKPASAPASQASGPQHPVDALELAGAGLPALQASDAYMEQALAALLGHKKVAAFLQLDGFVHRAVATVDNLPRAQAPARLWPVQPMPQRFTVEGGNIAPANAARYNAFVAFAEAVPMDAAVKLYARLYPLFQAAYEDLGYPRQYFNDRLVAVLDHLLAAPPPAQPVAVQLVRVEGEVPSTRPWVRYEFADPQLQALSSGQKILVRMGPDNARRLQAVLAELRRRVATSSPAR